MWVVQPVKTLGYNVKQNGAAGLRGVQFALMAVSNATETNDLCKYDNTLS